MTEQDLVNLKAAYASGVKMVREGDTWIEYQSAQDMRNAIKYAEAELGKVTRPKTQYVTTSQGY